jgi:hypothetical protein
MEKNLKIILLKNKGAWWFVAIPGASPVVMHDACLLVLIN